MARVLKNRMRIAAEQLEELLAHDHPASTPQMNIGELALRINLVTDDLDKITKIISDIRGMTAEWSQVIAKMAQKDQDAAQDDYDAYVIGLKLEDTLKASGTRVRHFKANQINLASAKSALETMQQSQQIRGGVPAAQATGTTTTTGRIQYQVEIAKIKPQIFSGGKCEWQSWWPVYNLAIHSDPSKPRFLKMADLMSLLKGEAKDMVYGLQLTDDDYDLAIKALTEKYDDNSHMIRELHRQLISLKASQSFDDDKKLLIEMQRITRMLKNNAQDINAPTIWLTLEQKVTKPVLRQLQEAKIKAGANWNTDMFLTSFKDLVIAEEAIEEIYNQSHPKREIGRKPKVEDKGQFKKFQSTVQTTLGLKSKIMPLKKATNVPRLNSVKKPQQNNANKRITTCRLCNQSHWTSGCTRYKDSKSREERAKEQKLCLKCLGINHSANECSAKLKKCWYYNKWGHNQVFCPQQFGVRKMGDSFLHQAAIQQLTGAAKPNKVSPAKAMSQMDTRAQHKLLFTKKVTVYNPENPKLAKTVLVFFDSGSERSYIEKELATFLKLEAKNPAEITLTGFAGVDLGTFTMHMTKLCIKIRAGEKIIEPEITTRILRQMAHVEVADLTDADFEATQLQISTECLQPQILIGTDYFADFDIKLEKQLPSGFWVANSKVGKLIFGKGNIANQRAAHKVTSTAVSQDAIEIQLQSKEDDLNSMVKQFFDLEAAGMADAAHPTDNEQWLDHFSKELHFNQEEKRYEVALPWNQRAEELQPNYGLARGRLENNLKKLDKEKFQLYDQIIQEQLKAGIVEIVPNPKEWVGKLHYLPHQAVIKDDHQTTKLRIVYDGSAHTKDTPSLNQCLDKGPQLLNDLIGIVMRCRMTEVLISADIEKAFLQILIKERDRDALRFLWVNTDGNIRTYRFRRVPFGLISSPAHLSVTLKHHLENMDHPLAKNIAQNLYVDNILLCTHRSSDISEICSEMKRIFEAASMNLREFGSNDKGLLKLPGSWLTDPYKMKILGIRWNPFKDELEFQLPHFQATKVTKRTILSHLASVFDPLGLLSPILLPGKLLLSKLWHGKYEWDEELTEELATEWMSAIRQWPEIKFRIPRTASLPNPKESAIHIFADASGKALGVCAYLRTTNNQAIHSALLFAKSLVVPLKVPERQNTIPRLELQALKIATNVAEKLEKELPEIDKTILWTDSRDALEWAKSTKKQDRYVENRLKRIRKYMVRFVAGISNPADIASRGLSATELLNNKLWQHGPPWMLHQEAEWPSDQPVFDPDTERIEAGEELPIMEMTLPTMEEQMAPPIIDELRFSSWVKLKRTVVYAFRFFQPKNRDPARGNLLEKVAMIPPISADEMSKAEQILIKNAQQRHPADLQLEQNLQLYMDENGLLRSKGRIEKGDIPESAKAPIFLPRKAEVTALIIRHIHNKLHAGVNNLLSELRQQYWVPQARRTIMHTLHNKRSRHFCHTCYKFKTKAFGQLPMPPLPQFRVDGNASRPFLNIGLDYFGPMMTKNGEKTTKVWGCIFTCAVTRGIHIELVNNLTAEAFLNALSRFCARRKVPKLIVSDNAKTFQLGSKAAQQIWQSQNPIQLFNMPSVQKTFAEKGIKWKFNIERAPWTGGFFEKMVHLVKEPLRKTLGKKLVDFEQLFTTLTEIEKIINDRPLTYISEAEQTTVLRPIDFISPYLDTEVQEIWSGEDLDLDDPEFVANPTSRQSLISKFKKARQNADRFWDTWQREYLTALRERQKSVQQGQRGPEIGEIVIIHDESPRNHWKLGKIVKLIPSEDGQIRSAVVLVEKRELKRPITKLYPLELKDSTLLETKNIVTNKGQKRGEIISGTESLRKSISEMDDIIELNMDELREEEEALQPGPQSASSGGESRQGLRAGNPGRARHPRNGGESHQRKARPYSEHGRRACSRRPHGAERPQRSPVRQANRGRRERSIDTRHNQRRHRTTPRVDNNGPCPQHPLPQRLQWAPHPPTAPPHRIQTAAVRPVAQHSEQMPEDGILLLKEWKISNTCNGYGPHSNCRPFLATQIANDLPAVLLPSLLHLILAQIVQEYGHHRNEVAKTVDVLAGCGLIGAELIRLAASKKPLCGFRYKMGQSPYEKGIPSQKKMKAMKGRGTREGLWWRQNDVMKCVQEWCTKCRVAKQGAIRGAEMDVAMAIPAEPCPEDHPEKANLRKMEEDTEMALRMIFHVGKKIITAKTLMIADETTTAFAVSIAAYTVDEPTFLNSVLGTENEVVILWTGSTAIQNGQTWPEYVEEAQPVVEKLIRLDKKFFWVCPPRMPSQPKGWAQFEEGFLDLSETTNCGQGMVLVIPFTDEEVSKNGFLTEAGVIRAKAVMGRILRGEEANQPSSLDQRLHKFVWARTYRTPPTQSETGTSARPLVMVTASTSMAVQSPRIEEPTEQMPKEEVIPWIWSSKRYFVDNVKVGQTEIRAIDQDLEEFILSRAPDTREREEKERIVDAIKQIFRWATWKNFEVMVVGSTRAGTDTANGDLDLVLRSKTATLSEEQRLRELEFALRELKMAKRQLPYKHCVLITRTKVPLIKIRTLTGIDVDVTMDNIDSITNSQWIAEQTADQRFWQLYMAVKLWAKFQGVGDAATGGLNSLCWALMTKHFLVSRGQEEERSLIFDFLRIAEYYSHFPFESYTITRAGWRSREASTEPIFVEDPHNPADNCARNRKPHDVREIKRKLDKVWQQFKNKGNNCRLCDLGFPPPRNEMEDFPPSQKMLEIRHAMEMDKESDHSDFDDEELVFEVQKEGEASGHRTVARWPDSHRSLQFHSSNGSSDHATNRNDLQSSNSPAFGGAHQQFRVPTTHDRQPERNSGRLSTSTAKSSPQVDADPQFSHHISENTKSNPNSSL